MNKQIVIITGASGGFGLLTALCFAKQGYQVIATMRDVDKGESLLQQAEGLQCRDNIQLAQLDITDSASINRFVQTVSRVDILVNNAGFACAGFSEDTALEEYRAQFDTNFFGAVAVTNALLPLMRKQRAGRIINVSSVSGLVGFPGLSPYVASKHALEGWSECLRLEVAAYGIYVSLIEPGSYKTNIWSTGMRLAAKTQQSTSTYYDFYERIQHYIADSQHNMGDPIDVAEKIVTIAGQKTPRLRYPIGKGVKLSILLKRLLPWRCWQWLILKTLR